MAKLVLKNVSKVFTPGVWAIKNISLELNDKECLVVLGPSGCGKSTLLRCIAGLDPVSGGTIELEGRIITGCPPKDRDIAMVFQDYALYPHMTAYENLAFPLVLRKVTGQDIRKAVQNVAELLGLTNVLSRYPNALSGGECQRVAFGRAVIRNPRLFLFDEPLSNLDANLRIELRAEIRRLHRTLEATTIFVTHDQREALALGDRIMVMAEGQNQQCARPEDLEHCPANSFVAGFFGDPPMSFISGFIVQRQPGLVFESLDGALQLPIEHLAAFESPLDVTLGIPVEAMTIRHGSIGQGPSELAVQVDLVEPHARGQAVVYARTRSGHRLHAISDAGAARADDWMIFRIEPQKAFVFERTQPVDGRSRIHGRRLDLRQRT